MTSATEELRRLLDERGTEHTDLGGMTEWTNGCGRVCRAYTRPEPLTVDVAMLAVPPEQAIAATLGDEPKSMRVFDSMETALTIAEKEVEIEELKRENAELYDENEALTHRRAELEAAMLDGGERTCGLSYQTGKDNPSRGWWLCDQCGGLTDSVGGGWDGRRQRTRPPAYCARCGARNEVDA